MDKGASEAVADGGQQAAARHDDGPFSHLRRGSTPLVVHFPVMRLASALLLYLLLVGACAVAPRQEQPPAPAPVPEVTPERPVPAPTYPEVAPERPPVPAPVYPEFKHGATDPSVT